MGAHVYTCLQSRRKDPLGDKQKRFGLRRSNPITLLLVNEVPLLETVAGTRYSDLIVFSVGWLSKALLSKPRERTKGGRETRT